MKKLTSVGKFVDSTVEDSEKSSDVTLLTGWNWGRWGNDWRIRDGASGFGTVRSIAFLSNATLAIASLELEETVGTPVGSPRVSDQPVVKFGSGVSAITNNKDGVIGGGVGTLVEDNIAIVAKRDITGIDASNSSSISCNQGLELVFITVIVWQGFGDIGTTVVNFQSCWAGKFW